MQSKPVLETQLLEAKKIESDLSISLEETAQWMMSVNGTSAFSARQAVYFPLLAKWRSAKKNLSNLTSQLSALNKAVSEPMQHTTLYALALEEKRAIKEATVTSTTYENAQRRLMREVDGFLSGKSA